MKKRAGISLLFISALDSPRSLRPDEGNVALLMNDYRLLLHEGERAQ